jgi:UDP-2-acetamido-3-amino-2,3-dideoxy-glucuronate N-acetyltransferase
MSYTAHPTAIIDQPCEIGAGTRIWHFAHICAHAHIGKNCVFGQNTMVAEKVRVGDNVKVQNNVAIYSGVEIEDDVFLGPSCVLTNISNPRSQVSRKHLYETTLICRGASIGANATIVCGSTIGRYALIGAGAVVAGNVPDYALMLGVPARQKGWVSRHGHPLKANAAGEYICPETGWVYLIENDALRCRDWPEDKPLPPQFSEGKKGFQEFKQARRQ